MGRGDAAAVLMSQMRMPPSPPPLITCGMHSERCRVLKQSDEVARLLHRAHVLRMHFTPAAVEHGIICGKNSLAAKQMSKRVGLGRG